MKLSFPIFLFCFITTNSIAQKNNKIIDFIFDTAINSYPDSTFDMTEVEGEILKVNLVNRYDNPKATAEFLRIDNYTYYYIQKNENNKVISEGKAVLEKTAYKINKIPIFDYNGNGNGNLIYNHFKFIKQGKWSEQLTDSTNCFGIYIKNKKEGTWSYVKSMTEKIGVLEKAIVFKNGNPGVEKIVEKVLIGTWAVENRFYNPNDSIYPFRKSNKNTSAKISIVFYKNGECKITGKQQHKSSSQIYQWVFENNTINIKANQKTIYTIDYLNFDLLPLRIII
jgi:hypothetical protein